MSTVSGSAGVGVFGTAWKGMEASNRSGSLVFFPNSSILISSFHAPRMENKENNSAFIDSQNLNLGIKGCGWELDFARFRVYLEDKYQAKKAFLFIGYVAGNEALYTALQRAGYVVIFKPTLEYKKGAAQKTKGNVDAELVLHTMIEYPNYTKAVIVSGDGDFHCLIEYLEEKGKLSRVLIPNSKKYSALLRRFRKYFAYLDGLKQKLERRRSDQKSQKIGEK